MVRVAIDLNLFVLMGEKEEKGASAEELARLTGAEHDLIGLSSFSTNMR